MRSKDPLAKGGAAPRLIPPALATEQPGPEPAAIAALIGQQRRELSLCGPTFFALVIEAFAEIINGALHLGELLTQQFVFGP